MFRVKSARNCSRMTRNIRNTPWFKSMDYVEYCGEMFAMQAKIDNKYGCQLHAKQTSGKWTKCCSSGHWTNLLSFCTRWKTFPYALEIMVLRDMNYILVKLETYCVNLLLFVVWRNHPRSHASFHCTHSIGVSIDAKVVRLPELTTWLSPSRTMSDLQNL